MVRSQLSVQKKKIPKEHHQQERASGTMKAQHESHKAFVLST
jgi:hypothetical protein